LHPTFLQCWYSFLVLGDTGSKLYSCWKLNTAKVGYYIISHKQI
jgi:hypothetical protein